jgi:hypothetical protein
MMGFSCADPRCKAQARDAMAQTDEVSDHCEVRHHEKHETETRNGTKNTKKTL